MYGLYKKVANISPFFTFVRALVPNLTKVSGVPLFEAESSGLQLPLLAAAPATITFPAVEIIPQLYPVQSSQLRTPFFSRSIHCACANAFSSAFESGMRAIEILAWHKPFLLQEA